jgi:hypothetical protein
MERFNIHGGLAFCEWDNTQSGGIHYRIVTVVPPSGYNRDHDNTVELAWRVADDMASESECQGAGS